jgi:putative oxidoreductase
VNVGLLLIRAVPGLLLIGHGTQKLFGWFGGRGLATTATSFESNGYRPGRPFAFLAGFGETAGGLLFSLGLLTPFASAAIVGVMLNAIVSVHWSKGIWSTKGGFEFPLTLAVVAAGVAFTGPGRFSVDRALDLDLRGVAWGIAAVGAGLASGIVTLVIRSRARRNAPS